MGVKPGWPDVQIFWRGRVFAVELKSGKDGRLSEAQRYRHAELIAAGCPVAVCRDLDQVRAKILEWGIPTRETRRSTEAITRGLAAALAVENSREPPS